MSSSHPFESLTPDFILDAVEACGSRCDGRLLVLNSYENRVYQVGVEGAQPIIVKFYRPARWSDTQIIEEHEFCFELAEAELPVVAPERDADGRSLFTAGNFRFCTYQRRGGHAPEIDDDETLLRLGRLIARMHLIGAARRFDARPSVDCQSYGHESAVDIIERFIPDELKNAYETLTNDLLALIDSVFEPLPAQQIRLHADCHVGNILSRDGEFHFVDFDDARMGPAIQDIWMLMSGDTQQREHQLSIIGEGYNTFREFPVFEVPLIEPLRALRMMHHAAWLARRWDDPAFPIAFPWFATPRYWEQHILDLREQFAAIQEPALNFY